MRHLHKSWQDKRPAWTRRVRWYAPGHDGESIRLQFTDDDGIVNRTYVNDDEARADFDAFRASELSVQELLLSDIVDRDNNDNRRANNA